MLTLEAAMLTAFGETMDAITRKLFLGLTGFAVCAFIILMALGMIYNGDGRLRRIKNGKQRKF